MTKPLRLCGALALLCTLTVRLSAYALTGSHWYTSPIVMQLQLGTTSAPLTDGSASWGASAEDALSVWNSVMGTQRFSVVRDSTAAIAQGNGVNNVFFSSTVYGQAWGTGVLAVTLTYTSGTSRSTECDVLFNGTLRWDSYRGALHYTTSGAVYDFHRVAMHEFGHVLGLDHPDQAGQSVTAVMNSTISNLDTLAADDVNGAQSLYGAPATSSVVAPTITSQPVSQSVTAGGTVSFSVGAASTVAMNYQWLKNGTPIAGANAATLTLAGVTSVTAGNYTVQVSNSGGTTTSSVATLTVTSPVTTATPTPVYVPTVTSPSITSQPANLGVAAGTNAAFSVSASGSAPLSYAWRKNGAAIAGATQSAYVIANVQPADAGNYSVVVSNSAGAVTSATATLTVLSTAPVITSQPANVTVKPGAPFTLSVTVAGTAPFSFQWQKNGSTIGAATGASLSVAAAQLSDAGSYTVTIANAAGTVTSVTALVAVAAAPSITSAPAAQTVAVGSSAQLSVVATGSPAPSYQWQKNGMNIAGATQATLVINPVAASDAGTYDVVITNAGGTVTTVPVLLAVAYSQLVNLSTRGWVRAGGALTTGFVLRGPLDKPLIVRAVGPTLNTFGVANALTDPQLTVISQDTAQTVTVNDNWSLIPQLASAFQSVGAFALPNGSADAASEVQLKPGAYTTRITSDAGGIDGVALAEIYDANPAQPGSRLVNLSTLGYSGAGDTALVAGFTVQGTVPKRVLIRAVGPTLSQFGVTGALSNPRLDVYASGDGTPLAGNDDWGGSSAVQTAITAAGAFPLSNTSRDAAAVLTLAPGGYTVVVTGVGGATGYALVEIYDLDP